MDFVEEVYASIGLADRLMSLRIQAVQRAVVARLALHYQPRLALVSPVLSVICLAYHQMVPTNV